MEEYKRHSYQITELAEQLRKSRKMTIYESLELAKKQLKLK